MRVSGGPVPARIAAASGAAALALGLALTALALPGCGGTNGGGGGDTDIVVVMAASSLTDVLEDVSTAFENIGNTTREGKNLGDSNLASGTDEPDETGGTGAVRIVGVLAGSSALAAQLAEGAEADVLMTADAATMQRAVEAGSVRGRVTAIATNALVLAVAPGNPGQVASLDDLDRADLLVGLCAAGVPCGTLADRALDRLGIEPAVDTRELNARALAAKIALGELDAGLVYATDAAALGLEIIAAAGLDRFTNTYQMASIHADPPAPVQAVLEAFEPDGLGAESLLEAGFSPP